MLVVCNQCDAARDRATMACPACRHNHFRTPIYRGGQITVPPPRLRPPNAEARADRKPRKADGVAIPTGAPVPDGYAPCTRDEYRRAAVGDRHPTWRAVRDGATASSQVAAVLASIEAAREETPAGAPRCRRQRPAAAARPAARRIRRRRRRSMTTWPACISAGEAHRDARRAATYPPRLTRLPEPAGGWDGPALYIAAVKLLGPKPSVSALHRLAICTRCNGLNAPTPEGELRCQCSPDRGGEMVSYRSYVNRVCDHGIPPVPEPPVASPRGADGCGPEWRSEDLNAALRKALDWQGLGSRMSFAAPPPTSLDILADVGGVWPTSREQIQHTDKHCAGYRIRGESKPAFWMGEDRSRPPTLEGMALVNRIRRALGLAAPGAAPKSGMDLVTSRPGSSPASNGSSIAEKPAPPEKPKRGRKATATAAAGGVE